MEFLRLPIIFLLCFVLSDVSRGSHADETLSPEMYWKHVLPNTPMPKAILDSLNPGRTDNKGTLVTVSKGGVGVITDKPGGSATHVGFSKGGVTVTTGPKLKSVYAEFHVSNRNYRKVSPQGNRNYLKVIPQGNRNYRKVIPQGNRNYLKVSPQGNRNYQKAAAGTQIHDDPTVALYFTPKDLKSGRKMTLQFSRSGGGAAFLPRHVAVDIPFSSENFSAALERLSVSPGSDEATAMKQTVQECEENDVIEGEEKRCATSLESMVDFAVSELSGRHVRAVSTDATADDGQRKEFHVTAVRKVSAAGGGVVACHKMGYPYAVFYCHKIPSTAAYMVSLAGKGAAVEAAAVCHEDTSTWNPRHVAFQVLKVKPGSVPVCHFLLEDHVVLVKN